MCLSDIILLVIIRQCVFNATFNNISVMLVEETGGTGENHRHIASHWQTLLHNDVHPSPIGIRTHNMSIRQWDLTITWETYLQW